MASACLPDRPNLIVTTVHAASSRLPLCSPAWRRGNQIQTDMAEWRSDSSRHGGVAIRFSPTWQRGDQIQPDMAAWRSDSARRGGVAIRFCVSLAVIPVRTAHLLSNTHRPRIVRSCVQCLGDSRRSSVSSSALMGQAECGDFLPRVKSL